MSNATHVPGRGQTSQHEVIATSPAWTTDSTFAHKNEQITSITHTWTAPTQAMAAEFEQPEASPVQVAVFQSDDLVLTPAGVHQVPGQPRVWIPDADLAFPNTTEARRFASAVIEACERIDGPGAQK